MFAYLFGEDTEAFEAVADEAVQQLGLMLDGLPPGQLRVTSVAPGAWAEQAGIQKGYRVLQANGEDVAEMDAERFKGALRGRPLTLLVEPVGEAPAEEAPPEAAAPEGGGGLLQSMWEYATGEASSREVVAGEDVEKLGLTLDGLPPGRLVVTSVAPGLWAEAAGLLPGEQVVQVNGEDLEAMAAEDFKRHLQARPVALRVEAGVPGDAAEPAQAPEVPPPRRRSGRPSGASAAPSAKRESMASRRASAAPEGERDVEAGAKVDRLGLKLQGLPPGRLEVVLATPGLWAASVGIRLGDTIAKANGEDLAEMEADRFRELLQRRPLRLRVIPAGEVASAVPTPKTLLRELAADQNFEDAWRTDEERRLARRGDVDAEDLEDYTMARVLELSDELDQLRTEHRRMLHEYSIWQVERENLDRARERELAREARERRQSQGVRNPLMYALLRSGRRRRDDNESWD